MGLPPPEGWGRAESGWLFAGLLALVFAADFWLFKTKRPTFSTALRDWAGDWPLWPWVCGFLLMTLWAHIFGAYFWGDRPR